MSLGLLTMVSRYLFRTGTAKAQFQRFRTPVRQTTEEGSSLGSFPKYGQGSAVVFLERVEHGSGV